MDDRGAKLVRAAIEALATANDIQPANLRFGAAVLTRSGNVYTSSVFWSATSTLLLHAEHAALAHAASHGERNIVAVACVSTEDPGGTRYCHPCGICRQLIYESAQASRIDVEVLMGNMRGEHLSKKVSELVPFPWPVAND